MIMNIAADIIVWLVGNSLLIVLYVFICVKTKRLEAANLRLRHFNRRLSTKVRKYQMEIAKSADKK